MFVKHAYREFGLAESLWGLPVSTQNLLTSLWSYGRYLQACAYIDK